MSPPIRSSTNIRRGPDPRKTPPCGATEQHATSCQTPSAQAPFSIVELRRQELNRTGGSLRIGESLLHQSAADNLGYAILWELKVAYPFSSLCRIADGTSAIQSAGQNPSKIAHGGWIADVPSAIQPPDSRSPDYFLRAVAFLAFFSASAICVLRLPFVAEAAWPFSPVFAAAGSKASLRTCWTFSTKTNSMSR